MTKAELRKVYLEKRLSLSEPTYLQLNRQLCDHFFASMELGFVRVIHTFLPIEKTREPDTWMIINRLKREFPHIRISVPRINTQFSILENFYLDDIKALKNNTWGIPEPSEGIPTSTDMIDMILVPLLAFDKQGNRVGYGRGFYDKFLATCRPDSRKVGLSFFPAVNDINDAAAFDIQMDDVITPEGAFSLSPH